MKNTEELKPCPLCGGRALEYEGRANCRNRDCLMYYDWPSVERWNNRPAPELPEGYRVEGDTLFKGEVRIAILYPNGDLSLRSRNLGNEDAQALAIWLQRRAR